MMQHCGFDPALSLGVRAVIGSDSILLTLSDESLNRGLAFAHMHFITQPQKIQTFMS